jgi:hypothetical protein
MFCSSHFLFRYGLPQISCVLPLLQNALILDITYICHRWWQKSFFQQWLRIHPATCETFETLRAGLHYYFPSSFVLRSNACLKSSGGPPGLPWRAASCRPDKKCESRKRSNFTVVLFAMMLLPPGWKPGSTSAKDGRRYNYQTSSER